MAVSYPFGGTSDSYVEDRLTTQRLAGAQLSIIDADTLAPVAGLLDRDGNPAAYIITTSSADQGIGFWKFWCDSPTVYVRVTDSAGTVDWGPYTSAKVAADAAKALINLGATVAALITSAGAGAHQNLTGRELPDQHPIDAVTGLVDVLLGLQPKGQAVLAAGEGQTISQHLTFSVPPTLPADGVPMTAVDGLTEALAAQLPVTQMATGFVIWVFQPIAQDWGTVSHAAGVWPASRVHPTIPHIWWGFTEPGGIAHPHEPRFLLQA